MELQPSMTMLDNYRRQHQRREQEESRQRPARPPEWALKLDPAQFKGETRAMLMEAQRAAPNGGVPIRGFEPDTTGGTGHPAMIGNAAGDRGMATASHLGDVSQYPSSTDLVDSFGGLIGGRGRL